MINITTTAGLELTDAIRDYVHKRVESLGSVIDMTDDKVAVDVELAKTVADQSSGDVYKVDMHVRAPGEDFFATETADDLYAAIDLVKDEVRRTIVSKHGKRAHSGASGRRRGKGSATCRTRRRLAVNQKSLWKKMYLESLYYW